jgi:hypothetical protein
MHCQYADASMIIAGLPVNFGFQFTMRHLSPKADIPVEENF